MAAYQTNSDVSPYNSFVYGPLILGEKIEVINQVTNYSDQAPHDLYTVPTGYKALISNISILNRSNSTTQGATIYYLYQVDSVFHFITPYEYSIAPEDRHNFPIGMVLDEGDILGYDSTQSVDVNVRICGILIPRIYPITCVYTYSAHSSTLYRLPAGKKAVFLNAMPPFSPYIPTVAFTNEDTGAYTCTTSWHDSVGATNYTLNSHNVSAKTIDVNSFFNTFNLTTAGDGIDIGTFPFFQSFSWVNLLEVDV